MAISYRLKRQIDLPLGGPDPDPNTSEPAELDVFSLRVRPEAGNTLTISHTVYASFEGPETTGASANIVAWEQDAETKTWVKIGPVTLTHRQKVNGTGIQDSRLFFQVLSVASAGVSTSLVLHATELGTASEPGYGGGTVMGTVIANQGTAGASPWPVTFTTPVPVVSTAETAGTTAVSNVPASALTVSLLAANAFRLTATIFNDSNKALTIKLGPAATSIDRTTQLPPKSEYNLPIRYTGIITGFWQSGATGSAAVTEFTP